MKSFFRELFYKVITSYVCRAFTNETGIGNQKNRETWLQKTLNNIPAGKKILDAGAGELQYKKFCNHLQYVSQDFAQYDGMGNSEGLQMQKWDNSKVDIISDISNLPVSDSEFDAVMCVEVFEHIPNPIEAVKEFKRVLKKDGFLILTAPFCSLTHFAPYYFANGYSKYWYEHVLESNGFKIDEITPNGNYFEYLAQELRRVPQIGQRYSNSNLFKKEEIAIKITLSMLERFSKRDKGSCELLNFGFHVKASKA